jgi:O-antigen/teichoic acid export membrane protein
VAIFLGLQRYRLPMMTTIVSRLAFGVVMCAAATAHASLATMGALAACVNLLAAVLQVAMWRKYASQIRVSISLIDIGLLKKMVRYCSVLLVWSLSAMLISGLDLTVVGHYSFSETAYYAIANAPVAFLVLIVSALMGPLLPAASAQSVAGSPAEMGRFLSLSTRLSMVGLLLTGLPFLVVGQLILRAWVGPVYALHSTPFLRVLIMANIIRSSCAPFSTMVLATGQQKMATASPVAEGIINLVASVWLVQHLGALGVALGTLIGACAGVAVHFAVSMRFTQSLIGIAPAQLFVEGMLRPSAIVLPSVPFLWSGVPRSPFVYCAWGVATLLVAWFAALTHEERERLTRKWQYLQSGGSELAASALAGEAGK